MMWEKEYDKDDRSVVTYYLVLDGEKVGFVSFNPYGKWVCWCRGKDTLNRNLPSMYKTLNGAKQALIRAVKKIKESKEGYYYKLKLKLKW